MYIYVYIIYIHICVYVYIVSLCIFMGRIETDFLKLEQFKPLVSLTYTGNIFCVDPWRRANS